MSVLRGIYKTTPTAMVDNQQREVRLDNFGAVVVNTANADGSYAPGGGTTDPVFAVNEPSAMAGAGLTRTRTTAVAGSLVVKASAGNLYGWNIVTGANAGYLMIFDATTVPADGTVQPVICQVIAANASIQSDRDIAIRFTTGIVMVFSTTGPFTKTISATAFLAGDAA